MKSFIMMSLLMLFFKSTRGTYLLLSLEVMMLGVILLHMSLMSDLTLICFLVFAVISSVMGFLIMTLLLKSYGSENVLL